MNKPLSQDGEIDDLLSVHLTRVIRAPIDRVFDAWTTADLMRRWWGPKGFQATSAAVDPRPGGAFAVTLEGPDGEVHDMAGVYIEVARPALVLLEIRHRTFPGAAERPEGYIPTRVRVELREHADGTELTLTHTGFLDAALIPRFDEGWSGSLEKLERSLTHQEE